MSFGSDHIVLLCAALVVCISLAYFRNERLV
jgi:hypothetical protein